MKTCQVRPIYSKQLLSKTDMKCSRLSIWIISTMSMLEGMNRERQEKVNNHKTVNSDMDDVIAFPKIAT